MMGPAACGGGGADADPFPYRFFRGGARVKVSAAARERALAERRVVHERHGERNDLPTSPDLPDRGARRRRRVPGGDRGGGRGVEQPAEARQRRLRRPLGTAEGAGGVGI